MTRHHCAHCDEDIETPTAFGRRAADAKGGFCPVCKGPLCGHCGGSFCSEPTEGEGTVGRDRSMATTIIHALWQGRTFCGKPGVPGSWPIDQRWFAVSDWLELASATEGLHHYEACAECDAAARAWHEKKRRRPKSHERQPPQLEEDRK